MKEMPDMDHFRPYLQFDPHIGGARRLGEAERVVEQGLGGADLDQ